LFYFDSKTISGVGGLLTCFEATTKKVVSFFKEKSALHRVTWLEYFLTSK